jgi:hypothetical protein
LGFYIRIFQEINIVLRRLNTDIESIIFMIGQ